MGRVGRGTWPHLDEFVALACYQGLAVWLFGSALRSATLRDLSVLLLYSDRSDVLTVRNADWWSDYDPPLDMIAVTGAEEEHYNFITSCGAVCLT
jgi:hypothetical protein